MSVKGSDAAHFLRLVPALSLAYLQEIKPIAVVQGHK
jgi:hypothetical protein